MKPKKSSAAERTIAMFDAQDMSPTQGPEPYRLKSVRSEWVRVDGSLSQWRLKGFNSVRIRKVEETYIAEAGTDWSSAHDNIYDAAK